MHPPLQISTTRFSFHCSALFPRSALRLLALAWMAALLAACGGGSGGSSGGPFQPSGDTGTDNTGGGWVEGEFKPASEFSAQCADPRTGTNPFNGEPYPDEQGSYVDENNWLRSMTNELYLWYDEVQDRDPSGYGTLAYFDLLMTEETLPSGLPKDRSEFHWATDTQEYLEQTQSGTVSGYGARFAVLEPYPPREIVVAFIQPDSPAAEAGLARGTRILEVDGVDAVNGSDTDTLNSGTFPGEVGEEHTFLVQDLGSNTPRSVTMVSTDVTTAAVQHVTAIPTDTGIVGYMLFNSHIATAETGLIDAVEQLQVEGVSDLVLDLRYNGGGYLAIASELAYMIAGDDATAGETFEQMLFNDKHTDTNPLTGQPLEPEGFYSTTQGFSEAAGQALPTLNLDRVYVLAGSNTCSASEAIINGLRGVNVEVVMVGTATCGKPYGAYVLDNCGTSYFTVQFKGVNAKGYGDYVAGFFPGDADSANPAELPGCEVPDDFDHAFGDVNEARLAAALAYRNSGSCPGATAASGALTKTDGTMLRDSAIRQPRALRERLMRR